MLGLAALFVPSSLKAQFTMEAGVNVGSATVDRHFPYSSFEWHSYVRFDEHNLSYGIEAQAGYKFKFGVGIYSGVNLDCIRLVYRWDQSGVHYAPGANVDRSNDIGPTYTANPIGITIPLKIGYTYDLKRIKDAHLRVYGGFGCGYTIDDGGFLSEYNKKEVYDYDTEAHAVVLSGLDIIWKRFAIGFTYSKEKRRNILDYYVFKDLPIDYRFRRLGVRMAWRIF